MEGRVPPHDIEAEQAVLGSMLLDKDAVNEALSSLKEDSFYREDNKMIFAAIYSLESKSEPIDLITVKNELIENGNFEKVGGIEYLSNLPDKVPTSTNVKDYIKIVEEKALTRKLIQTANDIIALGYDDTKEVDTILDKAEKEVFELSQDKASKGYESIQKVLVSSLAELERLTNQKGSISGLTTGFADLDRITSGLHNSDLTILAARPAMGKSALAINIATNVAKKENVPVVIFSLEMSKEQVANRILCSEAMVEASKVRTGQVNDEEWMKLASAAGEISDLPIYIDDTPGISVMEIRAKCRKLKMEKNIGLVVVDYLQLIQSQNSNRNTNREQEISEISRSLKILAKELDVPIIALSQLSRAAEKRGDDHRPMLSDLRESGAIEQDADLVLLLYREDYYNQETENKNIAEVIIAKQRSGATGTVNLAWLGNYTKFANLER